MALKCYSDVNACSTDLEQSSSRIISVRVAWTGLTVLRDGYDEKAWTAIHAGRLIQCCRKAEMIWTEPKPQTDNPMTPKPG
jgi:hypothetical protein